MAKEKIYAINCALMSLDAVDDKLMNQPEVMYLPHVLEDGEVPKCVVHCGMGLGFLFATDRRIVLVEKKGWKKDSLKATFFPYNDILKISPGKFSQIEIVTSERKTNILLSNKARISTLIEHVLIYSPVANEERERREHEQTEAKNRKIERIEAKDLQKNAKRVEIEARLASLKSSDTHFSDKAQRIDARWENIKPRGWGKNMHSGERKMLYSILDQDEEIEGLIGGNFRADTGRLRNHKGVAVATSRRVIFLDKGILGSMEVQEMPYKSMEAITYSAGMFMGGIQVTGLGMSGFRLEDIFEKDSILPFVNCVRTRMDSFTTQQQSLSPTTVAVESVSDEIAKFAELLKQGVITQEEFDAQKAKLLT